MNPENFYLEYRNEFLNVKSMMKHYNFSESKTCRLIEAGRATREKRALSSCVMITRPNIDQMLSTKREAFKRLVNRRGVLVDWLGARAIKLNGEFYAVTPNGNILKIEKV
jgi:hypothetical protein